MIINANETFAKLRDKAAHFFKCLSFVLFNTAPFGKILFPNCGLIVDFSINNKDATDFILLCL